MSPHFLNDKVIGWENSAKSAYEIVWSLSWSSSVSEIASVVDNPDSDTSRDLLSSEVEKVLLENLPTSSATFLRLAVEIVLFLQNKAHQTIVFPMLDLCPTHAL